MLWAALLAGIAGYVDAICFLRLGGAFAANMTGNLVEVGLVAAQGQWADAAWCVSLLLAFFLGVLAARLILRTHQSPRLSLLIEAAIIIAAATGLLGIAAVPALAVAMAMQNEAVTHGIVGVNVGFITGEIQRLGERLVAETVPGQPGNRETQAPIVLTILVFYAAGAAAGALAARWNAAALILPAAVLAAVALLPPRWTGLAAQRH
jgi:uncharacterized membrane protein YoaK (UPF0700 family)